ncbi:hypothetical protein K438DRAFT_799814 [Mycena galopus ATCC 62051]|nr:hypothetical protein K438DRAFT_799814 [Mycena galopus ATCC 62051]
MVDPAKLPVLAHWTHCSSLELMLVEIRKCVHAAAFVYFIFASLSFLPYLSLALVLCFILHLWLRISFSALFWFPPPVKTAPREKSRGISWYQVVSRIPKLLVLDPLIPLDTMEERCETLYRLVSAGTKIFKAINFSVLL